MISLCDLPGDREPCDVSNPKEQAQQRHAEVLVDPDCDRLSRNDPVVSVRGPK